MSAPSTYPGETLSKAIARRLRGQLAELQISQLDLCDLTGWGRMYIGRRLSGEKAIDVSDLEHIEGTVGIRAVYLLNGEQPALVDTPPVFPIDRHRIKRGAAHSPANKQRTRKPRRSNAKSDGWSVSPRLKPAPMPSEKLAA